MTGARRFLTLPEVAEELATSAAQVYALVRKGDLPAIKIGGRGQWRVERTRLEEWLARKYADTEQFILEHPFGDEPETDAVEQKPQPARGGYSLGATSVDPEGGDHADPAG